MGGGNIIFLFQIKIRKQISYGQDFFIQPFSLQRIPLFSQQTDPIGVTPFQEQPSQSQTEFRRQAYVTVLFQGIDRLFIEILRRIKIPRALFEGGKLSQDQSIPAGSGLLRLYEIISPVKRTAGREPWPMWAKRSPRWQ